MQEYILAPGRRRPLPLAVDGCLTLAAGIALPMSLTVIDRGAAGFWCLAAAGWLAAWLFVERLTASGRGGRWAALAVPVLFGVTLLMLWEVITRGLNVPMVLLPPPCSMVAPSALRASDCP